MRPKPAPALSEAEQRLRAIISKAPVVLFAADANGIVTLCEGKALQKLGKVSGQSVGQSLFDMYRSYPAVIANVRRALAGEAFSSLDELTGLGLCFEIHWAPIRAENGIPAGTIAVAVDVSERTRDERAREEAETLYRSLVEQLWPLVGDFKTVRHYVVMDDGAGEVPDDPRIVDYEVDEFDPRSINSNPGRIRRAGR